MNPEPLPVNPFPPIAIGTGLWALAAIALFIVRPTLIQHGAGWWFWVAVSGVALGLWGLLFLTVQHRIRTRRISNRTALGRPDVDRRT